MSSPVTTAGSPHEGLSPSLTHVGVIALSVFRLQVVQNAIPGSGKQIQLLQERCLLPIHGVGTDDAGSECATIAQLSNQRGMDPVWMDPGVEPSTVTLGFPDKPKPWEYWPRGVNICRSALHAWHLLWVPTNTRRCPV